MFRRIPRLIGRRLLSDGGPSNDEMLRRKMELRNALEAIKKELPKDEKPPAEFIEMFNKLASELKQTDVTAKQQLLHSPKSQDFRAMVTKRKNNQQVGVRYTADELKTVLTEAKQGKFPDNDADRIKRLLAKYELVLGGEEPK